MAVDAFVALMVGKLDKLLSKEAQLLGVHGEIKHIQQELDQMRGFLEDADIKQKENKDVRDWMEDIRDICFDVDDVIDILGQGQAAQGRHGFVERLKGRISDQITRYKVGKEIERIKLNIKGILRRVESYGITKATETKEEPNHRDGTRDIDKEGRLEAQPDCKFSTPLGESEEVRPQEEINSVSEKLTKEETDEVILEALWFRNRAWFLNKAREEEEELEEEEARAKAREKEKEEEEARARAREEEAANKESALVKILDSAPRLQELSTRSVTPEKIEKGIRVDNQLPNEERTRDIDEGRQEASSSSRNISKVNLRLQRGNINLGNQVSGGGNINTGNQCQGNNQIARGGNNPEVKGNIITGTGGKVSLGVQRANVNLGNQGNTQIAEGGNNPEVQGNIIATGDIVSLGVQRANVNLENQGYIHVEARAKLMKEEEEIWARARARATEEEARKRRFVGELIDSAPRLQERSTRSVTPEKIEKAITRVDDQLTNEERTRDIDEGRQEASSSSRNLQAHRPVSTLPGEPEEVGLQEEISTVGQQLIEEEPRLWDGTRDISEGSTLLGHSDVVGLQEEINTVDQQLIKEKPSHCDDTSGIDEVPEYRDGSKKRKLQPIWSERVRVSSGRSLEDPPDDGHCWRKYGQKDILGDKYPRSYYRCAHKHLQGCLATKQVQRSDEDPSIFCVVYQGLHTCTAPLYLEKGTIEEVKAEQPDDLQAEQPDDLLDCSTIDGI